MLMMKENNENNLKILATKADLKEEIARLDVKISDVKSDIIRWVFAFFVATMLAIAGLYLKIILSEFIILLQTKNLTPFY